jgi:broad specificity phosphatase PhoE
MASRPGTSQNCAPWKKIFSRLDVPRARPHISNVTTRICLIRHGATLLSAEDRFAGRTDVRLSAHGREQASRLAARLAGHALAAVYASPLSRAMETAELVAAPHGLAVTAVDALREIDHGHWEERTRAEVERDFGEEYARWEHDPYTFAPAGGETGLAVTARAMPALLEIVARHDGARAVIVSHKATIRLLLSSLLGFDPRKYRDRLDQSPCALNLLDFKDGQHARLTLFNDTSHYADEPEIPHDRLSKVWGE